jgi:rod shape-determining protein MreC
MPLFVKLSKNVFILALLILFQLVLISLQLPQHEESTYFEKAIFSIFSPVQHGVVSFFGGIGRLWKDYVYLKGARKENKRIKADLSRLENENNLLRVLLQKYRSEAEVRETLADLYDNVLPVRVIGFDTNSPYRSVTVNKGSMDGVRKDMFVLDKNGYLAGRIVEPVTLKESRIQLITDENSGISVYSEKEEAIGILSGDGKGNCLLKYIVSSDNRVALGERIFTSGFDEIFPRGIEVGWVVSVIQTSSLFKDILVKPSFDFENLDQMAVIMLDVTDFF